jgi:hypothetical protein
MVYPLARPGRHRPCSRRGLAMSLATQRRRAVIGRNEAAKRLRVTAEPRFIAFQASLDELQAWRERDRLPLRRPPPPPGGSAAVRLARARSAGALGREARGRPPAVARVSLPLGRGLVVQRVHASSDAVCDSSFERARCATAARSGRPTASCSAAKRRSASRTTAHSSSASRTPAR